MRQLTLSRMLGIDAPNENDAVEKLQVMDLFCGLGGFSEGARAAGCHVVFACDADRDAIDAHAINHPSTNHWCSELPRDDLPFPKNGKFHIHGSPPCQQFSTVRAESDGDRDQHAMDKAKELVEWYVTTAVTCGAASWSMEQVASKRVVEILERLKKRFANKVAFGIFKFNELGVPQTRRRVIAGSPHLVARLQRLSTNEKLRRSVRDVIAKPRGTHLRNSKHWTTLSRALGGEITYTKSSLGEHTHTIDGPAPTVLCGGGCISWVIRHANGKFERKKNSWLTVKERLALQTFPASYKIPPDYALGCRLVGNAVPPRIATLMMTDDQAGLGSDSPISPSLFWKPRELMFR